jgi:SAM-dependent methyltransferase
VSGTVYPFIVDMLTARIGPNDDVLELGCGGKVYRDLIPGRYVGLDLPDTPYATEEPPDIAASAEQVPRPDNSFDAIFTVATLLIVPDAEQALRECRRLLRTGGRLLVFDYQQEMAERLAAADPDHRHAWDYPALRDLLASAGFPRSGVRDLSPLVMGDQVASPARGFARRLLGRRTQWLAVEAKLP